MARRIIVVGGGISGLAAAHRLVELGREKEIGLEILLLETGQRLGGAIATERIGEFLVEAGPDSFISEKPWALELCQRLGIAQRLISPNPTGRNIFVVHKGSLQPLPNGFLLLAPTRLWPLIRTPLFSWRGKLRMAMEIFLPRRRADGDESLASFVRRRFGAEVLERVAQPLIGSIYAADPEDLSLAATMPRFLEMERKNRSVILAMRRSGQEKAGSGPRWSLFLTPAGGMQELIDAIVKRLPTGTVRLGAKVTGLFRNATKKTWIVSVNEGETLEADGIVLATPAYVAAELLSFISSELYEDLSAIPYSSTATVSLAYPEEAITRRLAGFGFVVPAKESLKIMACAFSSIKYAGRAPEGSVLLRAFVGGALQLWLLDQDDRAMEASVHEELAELLGVRAKPLFSRIHRHPRSMPQYRVGHRERLQRIETHLKALPRLALAGNAYEGVGIPDCIHSGEKAAEAVLEALLNRQPSID